MPTSQTIARLKAKLESFLTETCDISRREQGVDSARVPTNEVWAVPHAEGVSCRVIDARSRMSNAWREVAQTDAMVDMVRIVFPQGTDVGEDCRVVVGARVYHVVEVLDDRTDALDVLVHAKRIRGNDDVS